MCYVRGLEPLLKRTPSPSVIESGAKPAGARVSDLVRRFRAGDGAAFDGLVARLTPRLYSLALRALGSADAAEEVVQEAWVRIFRRIRDVQDPEAFEGWAVRVTLSRIHDEFRHRARERAARDALAGLRLAAGTPPERFSAAEREDLARILREGLASLDDAHREAFILRELEGLPHAEIARVLGIPEGTVWSRLSYARRALREYFRRRRKDDLS